MAKTKKPTPRAKPRATQAPAKATPKKATPKRAPAKHAAAKSAAKPKRPAAKPKRAATTPRAATSAATLEHAPAKRRTRAAAPPPPAAANAGPQLDLPLRPEDLVAKKPGPLARLKSGVGSLIAKMTGRGAKQDVSDGVPPPVEMEVVTADIIMQRDVTAPATKSKRKSKPPPPPAADE